MEQTREFVREFWHVFKSPVNYRIVFIPFDGGQCMYDHGNVETISPTINGHWTGL